MTVGWVKWLLLYNGRCVSATVTLVRERGRCLSVWLFWTQLSEVCLQCSLTGLWNVIFLFIPKSPQSRWIYHWESTSGETQKADCAYMIIKKYKTDKHKKRSFLENSLKLEMCFKHIKHFLTKTNKNKNNNKGSFDAIHFCLAELCTKN